MNALRLLLAALAALLLAVMVTSSCAATSAGGLLPEGTLAPCPSSPNCACSEGPRARVAPLEFTGDPDAAFASLIEFLRAEPRVELVTVEPNYVHAVFRTVLLRFRDDLELRLDREGHRIHVRSASRVGYSDLGANRKRIESLRERS